MIRRPPIVTLTDTRVPYTTLFRAVWQIGRITLRRHDNAVAVDDDIIVVHFHSAGESAMNAVPLEQKRVGFGIGQVRSAAHTSEPQSLIRPSYAVFCLQNNTNNHSTIIKNLNRDLPTTIHNVS